MQPIALLTLLSMLSIATSLYGAEKRRKLGRVTLEGQLQDVRSSFNGTIVPLGSTLIFMPSEYGLDIKRADDSQVYKCWLSRLPETLTTGDTLTVQGNLVETVDSFQNVDREVEKCKVVKSHTTPNSRTTFIVGEITSKGHESGLIERIVIEFRSNDGETHLCSRRLTTSLRPDLADLVFRERLLADFDRYKVGDKIEVSGFPSLQSPSIGNCVVRGHTSR